MIVEPHWNRNLSRCGRLTAVSVTCAVLLAPGNSRAAGIVTEQYAAAERAEKLRTEIARHDERYFKQDRPEISDQAYDQLKRDLAALEQQHPELAQDGGVGDDRSGLFPTYRHRQRMLSLHKSYTEAELRAFAARVERMLGTKDATYVVEPKFDGLAISLTFEHGRLVRAVTRGNGDEGDDVTANVRTIHGLPDRLAASAPEDGPNPMPDLIELRGEIFVRFAEFNRINREREEAGLPLFANPRNLAAGSLRQLEPDVAVTRDLDIVFYGCGACEPAVACPGSQMELLRQLRRWGLPTVDNPRVVKSADALCEAVREIGRERRHYAFPTDGAVVKVNNREAQRALGETTEAPLWAMAFKYPPDQAETLLRAIVWQVGRSGVLTPVAELEPVRLGGSKVSRASLYNAQEISRRDIRVGDHVYVEKAGEIIPMITGVDLVRRQPGARRSEPPTHCPECGVAVASLPGSKELLFCRNDNCPARVRRRIEHFASKSAANIAGLGPGTVAKLVAAGRVRNVADLFRLRRSDLIEAGIAAGNSERLLKAIERSKHVELWRLINGLGIPQVGETTARIVAIELGSLEALARWEERSHDGAGESKLGREVFAGLDKFMHDPAHRALVQALVAFGVGRSATPNHAG